MDDANFSDFLFHEQNPKVWPFIGKLLRSSLLWCCLVFDFVILEKLSLRYWASGVKGLTNRSKSDVVHHAHTHEAISFSVERP